MAQLILPIFPKGVAHITGDLAVASEGERVAYFHGALPVFTHERSDIATFRMMTSQFVVNGNCQQRDIVRLYHLANRMSTAALQHLCEQLTTTETVFPGTNLRLVYTLVSSQSPRDQEV